MPSRWRTQCFFNRPAKQIYALIDGVWLDIEHARPFLKRHSFAIMREHYYATLIGWHKWGRESFFNRPAGCESMTHGPLGYSYSFCPIFQAHGFSVKSKQSGLNSIVLLLLACSPATIARFVVAVFVRVSIKCRVGWARPHICQEVEKRIPPPFADGYSSPAISVIASGIAAVATRFHHFPGIVFRAFLCRMPASFRMLAQWNRIFGSHLTFLENDWVDRAESVHNTDSARFIVPRCTRRCNSV